MNFKRQADLVRKLVERTAEGLVDWETSAEDDTYNVSFIKNSLRISKIERSLDLNEDYMIELVNANGLVVESFTDSDLSTDDASAGENWYLLMKGLHNSARRRAHGADEVLEQVMKDLDDLFPF